MKEFFETEITPTVGSQLLWLVVTVLITLFITLFLDQTKNLLKKIFVYFKGKVTDAYNTPINKQKRLYKKIRRFEKKNKEIKPKPYPEGVSIGDVRKFNDKRKSGLSLEYGPLNELMIEYQKTYAEKLEKYYELHPEEKEQDELRGKKLEDSFKETLDSLQNIRPHNFPGLK